MQAILLTIYVEKIEQTQPALTTMKLKQQM